MADFTACMTLAFLFGCGITFSVLLGSQWWGDRASVIVKKPHRVEELMWAIAWELDRQKSPCSGVDVWKSDAATRLREVAALIREGNRSARKE